MPRRKRDGVRVVEVPVAAGFSIRSVPAMLRASARCSAGSSPSRRHAMSAKQLPVWSYL